MLSSSIARRRFRWPQLSAVTVFGRFVEQPVLNTLRKALSGRVCGRLVLALPSGKVEIFGTENQGREVRVSLQNYRVVPQMLRRGLLGFAECFIDGDIECDDLPGLFSFYFQNEPAITAIGTGVLKTGLLDRIFHAARDNSKSGSQRNIAAHYDLGNEFYREWLGDSWFYSSGIYEFEDESLEAAQKRKCQHILEALDLSGRENLLEIGCGWGAFAVAAAQKAQSVRAVTISNEQFTFARDWVTRQDLNNKVEICFQDYRDIAGQFDRIVSIEMIEAVGESHWPEYFQVLHDRLKPGGLGVIQAITISPAYFDTYRRTPDFIQRYIFPGGMLPTVERMGCHAQNSGLRFETIEAFGSSYADTLADWRRRFLEAWPRISMQGYDERFKRMWIYYLTYCEAGFRQGTIDVGLYRVTRLP